MAVEAKFVGSADDYEKGVITAGGAIEPGDVLQYSDGRACVALGANDYASGDLVAVALSGEWEVTATSTITYLKGVELFWDLSANVAHMKYVATGDFCIGVSNEAVASATSPKIRFWLNGTQRVAWSLRDPRNVQNTIVETNGLGLVSRPGGIQKAALDNTSEAATISLLSGVSVPFDSEFIFVAVVNFVAAAGSATDINIGVANAAHATDADSITESVFFHVDGASANILLESDDGTTEVVAEDSTIDLVTGTPLTLWIHSADHSDIQMYIDGVNVKPSSTYTLAAATGPIKALFMVEKTTATNTFDADIIDMKLIRFEDGASA